MMCLGLEPGAAGWKAQTNPLSYGGTPKANLNVLVLFFDHISTRAPTHTLKGEVSLYS